MNRLPLFLASTFIIMEKERMKRISTLLASASLLLVTEAACAESAQLSVSGKIAPGGACNVTVGSGTLDLGRIDRGMLNPDPTQPTTDLAEQRVKTMVDCASPTRYAFVVTEAKGQGADADVFNLYDVDSEAIPGKLFLLFDTQSTKIDGKQGYATGSSQGTSDLEHATWGPATSPREDLPITNGRYAVGFVTTPLGEEAPGNIKNLSVYLRIRPVINPLNELSLVSDIAFASNIGLEIRYF